MEGEDCLFFDSVDCLPFEESVVSGSSGFEIWLNEPQSVEERRRKFLCEMGLVKNSEEMMGLDRITSCSKAVSRSLVSSRYGVEENFVSCRRDCEANSMDDELEHNQLYSVNVVLDDQSSGVLTYGLEREEREARSCIVECENVTVSKKKIGKWWKCFVKKKVRGGAYMSEARRKTTPQTFMFRRMEVRQNKKRCKEFTALCAGQEIQAHKGLIWTMKFSPDGQYLATGGEDGVVRVWRVSTIDASCKYFAPEGSFRSEVKQRKSTSRRKKKSFHGSVVIPDKVFRIEESPVHEFHGHSGDVLDLAWSNSKSLLSSSKDKTVRLWKVGVDQCVNVFRHNNYVTCIQFNPVDENYFISGSIDGKARIWGVLENRVVDWADGRDVITAISYQPDGKGFAVGTITGTCRFYVDSGKHLELESQILIQGRKKTPSNKITGIQFSREKSQRVMITSEDSKLRILDGIDIVRKYKGLPKSGSQMSASLTSSGKHIISVGEDSRVYIWNYDGLGLPSSKPTKSVRTCENFFSDGVSVAIPWSRIEKEQTSFSSSNSFNYSQQSLGVSSRTRDYSDRFSLSNLFLNDRPCRRSATWPEEKLPLWDLSVTEDEHDQHVFAHQYPQQQQQQQRHVVNNDHLAISETWGLVILTGGCDGTIRTFHNYGLPLRL